MSYAADNTRVAISPETVAGTTDANPNFEILRVSAESLQFNPSTQLSDELNPDRGVKDSVLVDAEVTGDMTVVLAKHAALELLLEAALCDTWTSDILKVGSLQPTFTIEKDFFDGTTHYYHRFTGCVVNTMSMQIQPGSPIAITFGFIGRALGLDTAELAGATYNNSGTNNVMRAPRVTNIAMFGIGNLPCASNLQLDLSNNVRGISCIGHLGADEQVWGRAEVSLNGTIYFANNALMQRLVDQSEGAVSFRTQDDAVPPNFYNWAFPRVKLQTDGVVAGGTGQDVVNDMTMQALHDESAGVETTMEVARA